MDVAATRWRAIRSTIGVRHLVCQGDAPTPVPQGVVEDIQAHENQDGLVAVRDLGAAALRDRSRVKKLVADENRDRNALYREIARANGHPEWEAQIRSTFAKVWIQEAGRGYWYQAPDGSWRQR